MYKVVYSNRKTLAITVRRGEVTVRAPYGCREETITLFVNKNREWIEKSLSRTAHEYDPLSRLSPTEIEEFRERTRVILTAKTKKYSEIMGLKYGRITITGAKTRFGSCSSKGNISYSYRLMLYPEAAIDYVVVHELAHLKEMNHSKKFYAIIEKILPDYKERIKLLKRK
jgi:predicted metal-dependent hydrolase